MSKINTEIEDRKRADTTITNNLNQEITNRESDVDGVRDALELHENNKNNPHEVTKSQIGLGNVTNTVGVTKLNNIDGNVNLVAGANVTISNDPTGKNITIGSTGGGGGGSDVTVNGLQGAINIVGSGRASVSTSGQNITINSEPYEGGTGISIVANDINNDGVLGLTANDASNDPLTGYITVIGSIGINVRQSTTTGGEKRLSISHTGPVRRNAVFSMKNASGTATGFTGKAILEFPFTEAPYLKGWLYTGTINIPSTIGNNFSLDFAGSNFIFDYEPDPTYPNGTPRFFVIDTDCKIIGFFTHTTKKSNKLVFTLKTPGATGSLVPTLIPIISETA